MYEYAAHVDNVYDGDTITVTVDLGFTINVTKKVRLDGINSPELRGDELELGRISRDRLRELILDKDVIIRTDYNKSSKYGKYSVEVFIEIDGELLNVNDWLVENKLAKYISILNRY